MHCQLRGPVAPLLEVETDESERSRSSSPDVSARSCGRVTEVEGESRFDSDASKACPVAAVTVQYSDRRAAGSQFTRANQPLINPTTFVSLDGHALDDLEDTVVACIGAEDRAWDDLVDTVVAGVGAEGHALDDLEGAVVDGASTTSASSAPFGDSLDERGCVPPLAAPLSISWERSPPSGRTARGAEPRPTQCQNS